jgi:hypothetical protein
MAVNHGEGEEKMTEIKENKVTSANIAPFGTLADIGVKVCEDCNPKNFIANRLGSNFIHIRSRSGRCFWSLFYDRSNQEWSIQVGEGKEVISKMAIEYCPTCGMKLPVM